MSKRKQKGPTKITAWSYSRLDCWDSCPRQFKYRNIDKLWEPKAQPMVRGIKIHGEAANFLDGSVKLFPESCKLFEDQFRELKSFKPIIEQKWAFTKRWFSCKYFDKKTYLRVTLDALVTYDDRTADMIDHKTGKYRPGSYGDQKILFAAAVMKKFKKIEHVTARMWFLDTGDEDITELSRDEAFEGLAELEDRADQMINATRWPATPSWKCDWCHFRRANDGPCEF